MPGETDGPDRERHHTFCDCAAGRALRARRAEHYWRASRLPAAAREWTLETFAALNLPGKHLNALDRVAELLDVGQVVDRGKPRRGLFLHGRAGSGKTGLAIATANALIQIGTAVMFQVVPDLLDYLRSTYAPSSEVKYDELFDAIRLVDMLILDDLGTEVPTRWAVEKLFQIVDYRYRERLGVIVTSNLSPEALITHFRRAGDFTGERIADRLMEMCALVRMDGHLRA